jgi:hypothetical protein
MTLLRDSLPDLRAAFLEAADQLGIGPRQVEKDYWVTEILRELVAQFDGEFLFKGGTSLSKAYGLIERFSEDIDLLLMSEEGGQADAPLAGMDAAARTVTGMSSTRASGTDGSAARFLVEYPKTENLAKSAGMRAQIVLEPGIRGGPRPHERRSIDPLLGSIAATVGSFDDAQPFEIDVLHPARTMVEKLFIVDGIAARLIAEPVRRMVDTEARHFYDLHRLWEGTSVALEYLDKEGHKDAIYADCVEVSQRWFAEAATAIPDSGFAKSEAFTNEVILDRLVFGGHFTTISIGCIDLFTTLGERPVAG